MGYLYVDVTQSDIDRGIRGNKARCPVAQAIQRRHKCGTLVNKYSVYTWSHDTERGGATCYIVSHRAKGFITRFDRGETVEPQTFRLRGV